MNKATERAHKNMHKVSLAGTTIPHEVIGKVAGARVLLKPASQGTGVIAGSGVRAVLEAAGVHDILTKIVGECEYSQYRQSYFCGTGAIEISSRIKCNAWHTGKRFTAFLGTEEKMAKTGKVLKINGFIVYW